MTDRIAAEKSVKRRAIVIFDSRYGNTEKIAKSLETGLKVAGFETLCVNQREVSIDSLREFDLIAVGAPTERITASDYIKEFLRKVMSVDLKDKYGFAFDTRFSFPLSGSAAKFIEKELKKQHIDIVMPRESAFVVRLKEVEGGVKLKEGEEKRFEQIGRQLGTALIARSGIITT